MKSHTIILVVLAAAGCATPLSRIESPPAVPAAALPAAPIVPVADYTYQLLTPKNTGLTQVFDDGNSTFMKFESEVPPGLMIFDENGKPLAFAASDGAVTVATVRTGLLLRTPTQSSYAQANSPRRTAQIESFEDAGSPRTFSLPADLAAARAEILAAQSRLAGLSAEIELAARGEGRVPLEKIHGEIEAIQTRLNGINASLVRTHFAFGNAALSLSASARQALIDAARAAELVRIEGGADSVGAAEFNIRLAMLRARNVQRMLIEGGIAGEKLRISAVTQAYIASNETSAGRAENRRVDVIFVPARVAMTGLDHW